MGHMHTLRRAIERDPESWIYTGYYGKRDALPAFHHPQRGWVPGLYWSTGYQNFVRHVLRELGKLTRDSSG